MSTSYFAEVEDGDDRGDSIKTVKRIISGSSKEILVNSDDGSTVTGAWFQTGKYVKGGIYYSPNDDPDDDGFSERKNFAVIGEIYDVFRDAFYSQKPYDSWILDDNTCLWEAPSAKPTDGNNYVWNENNKKWVRE